MSVCGVYDPVGRFGWFFFRVVLWVVFCLLGLMVLFGILVGGRLSLVVTFLVIMGAVAFFTLLERKLLGYYQVRLGPNKVGLKGIPQPISDAMKLFLKESLVPSGSNRVIFVVGPCLMLVLCVGVWVLYPVGFGRVFYLWGFLIFGCISSAGVYGVIIVGWSSNSKYAYLGCVRAVAQFISYEVVMVIIVLVMVIAVRSFDLVILSRIGFLGFGIMLPLVLMWLVRILAETNRAPFDFVEGESELVSGFNVEYGGVGFAMIFIAEYRIILFMRILTAVVYFGGFGYRVLIGGLVRLLVAIFVVLCRGGLPRFRYDLLIMLTWKYFLPVVLVYLAAVVVLV